MRLQEITPVIITYNEAPNIARVLRQLRWARQVVVVDSFSRDNTAVIAEGFPNVIFVQHHFESFARQCNFAMTLVETPWVLSLDADYVCSSALPAEIEALSDTEDIGGFAARFSYCINGRPLRTTIYPPRIVLHRKTAHYEDDGHAHRVRVSGRAGTLRSRIFHDDRKSLESWLSSQRRYAVAEVDKLLSTPLWRLRPVDRLRRRGWIVPLLVPFHCLFVKRLILDGRIGLFYTMQRTYAELGIALEFWSRTLPVAADDTQFER